MLFNMTNLIRVVWEIIVLSNIALLIKINLPFNKISIYNIIKHEAGAAFCDISLV